MAAKQLFLEVEGVEEAAPNFFSLAHMEAEFYTVLSLIKGQERNYAMLEALVYRAVGLARALGLRAGVRIDAAEPDWSLVCIELPKVGQVAWRCPAFTARGEPPSAEANYARLEGFLCDRGAPC